MSNENTAGRGVGCDALLAVLGEDGWMSPAYPPNTDRTVQISWDDMSYGPNSLGFYDGIAEIPDSGRRFWWSSPAGRGFHQLSAGSVGAWRERSSANAGDVARPGNNLKPKE